MIKLNIGCGGRPLKEYINIDMDSKADLEKRYPNLKIDDDIIIKNYDIFNLPFNKINILYIFQLLTIPI